MINLTTRTEYSFLKAFGLLDEVVERGVEIGDSLGICDNGTYGHIPFYNKCKKAGIKPILGMEFTYVEDVTAKTKGGHRVCVVAMNYNGLQTMYQLANEASKHQYYVKNRVDYPMLRMLEDCVLILDINQVKPNIWNRLKIPVYVSITPSNSLWARNYTGLPYIAASDNYFPLAEDKQVYDVLKKISRGGNTSSDAHNAWILDDNEYQSSTVGIDNDTIKQAMSVANEIASEIDIVLPKASIVKYPDKVDMMELCRAGAKKKGIKLVGDYKKRLTYEMDLINSKGYGDYFLVVSDMCRWAKERMLVGPSRGSSAGSLVCYLLDITEIDPLRHNLFFERFIDASREDLPDIDMDFPDDKRELVFRYLQDKYGHENVSNIGTVSRFKPKSAIGDVAKVLGIPPYETAEVKDAIIERSGGDARATFCIADTFKELDIGRSFIHKYPQMRVVERIEAHARHTGKHAAGVFVCNEPITNYAAVDESGDHPIAMLDKKDAEHVNLLKIDVLGLRTLTVVDNCLSMIGKKRSDMYSLDIDDPEPLAVINQGNYAGIFQFEGWALKSVVSQMGLRHFNDIVAITALARPGPLHSGGATEYVKRAIGEEPVTYPHESLKELTGEWLGIIIYQEQVMAICRNIGNFSWIEVQTIRRSMAKSLGDEFFSKYEKMFIKGAKSNGVDEDSAKRIWDNMCTFGSWAFNLSHAVSYAYVSFWCMYLKHYHSLEFTCAALMDAKGEDQAVKILRDFVAAGGDYVPFDSKLSDINWSIKDGKLLGGLTGAKGIGTKMAEDIVYRRKNNIEYTNAQKNLLQNPTLPWGNVNEAHTRFKDYYEHPEKMNIVTGEVVDIVDIRERGTYIFLAKLKEKNQRDLNETQSLVRRGGRRIEKQNLFLNMVMEDDTDMIMVTVDRFKYEQFGKPIVEEHKKGDWFLIKGSVDNPSFRKIKVKKIKFIGGDSNERSSDDE